MQSSFARIARSRASLTRLGAVASVGISRSFLPWGRRRPFSSSPSPSSGRKSAKFGKTSSTDARRSPDRFWIQSSFIIQLVSTKRSTFLFQLFWEKRLENLSFLPPLGDQESRLPATVKPVGPCVSSETALQVCTSNRAPPNKHAAWKLLNCDLYPTQSLVSALHTVAQGVSITGQTGSKSALEKNAGVFLNPEQPLVQVGLVFWSNYDECRERERETQS